MRHRSGFTFRWKFALPYHSWVLGGFNSQTPPPPHNRLGETLVRPLAAKPQKSVEAPDRQAWFPAPKALKPR